MKVNIFLFDDFDTTEAFIPAGIFGKSPENFFVEYYSINGEFVTSMQGIKIWTESVDSSLSGDVLVIPGGKGARRLIRGEKNMCGLLKQLIEHHSFCVMLGSGTSLAAQTGVLYRRTICDYPLDENWNRIFTAAIYRMPGIKWAADGKFYSASTALAGLEMCLDIIADLVDFDEAMRISEKFGYTWNPEEEEGIYR